MLAATGASVVAPAGPAAHSPSLIWRDVRAINLLCVLDAPLDPAGRPALQAKVCERMRAAAAQGAPVPVRVIPIGDPSVLAADTVTLLLHASVRPGPRGGRLLAFSLRPFRVSAEQTAELFGAAPRAVMLSDDAGVDRALNEAAAELLPWRARPAAPRPIR